MPTHAALRRALALRLASGLSACGNGDDGAAIRAREEDRIALRERPEDCRNPKRLVTLRSEPGLPQSGTTEVTRDAR